MRKKLFVIIVIIAMIPAYHVFGHVVGAFTDFLVSANKERAHERLIVELQETERGIEKLTIQASELEEKYDLLESDMIETILFYDTVAFNSYLHLLFSSEDILQFFTAQEFLQRKMLEDAFAMNYLYVTYQDLVKQQEALQGQVMLLEAIEQNLLKRKEMFRRQPFLEHEPSMLAEVLAMTWEQEAEFVDEMIESDFLAISENPERFFIREDHTLVLNERAFNELSDLTYLFRSQHAHIHFSSGQADLILIGDLTVQNNYTLQFDFDVAFLNSFVLSPRMVDEFKEFKIDLSKLGVDISEGTVKQSDYSIEIQF